MGKPAVKERTEQKESAQRWPFDPMQPGDHEPVRLPEELERVQKQTGVGERKKPDGGQ